MRINNDFVLDWAKVKKLLHEKRLEHRDLVERSGLSVRSIQDYSSGKSKPGIESIHLIAKALDVEVADILESGGANNIWTLEVPASEFYKDHFIEQLNKLTNGKNNYVIRILSGSVIIRCFSGEGELLMLPEIYKAGWHSIDLHIERNASTRFPLRNIHFWNKYLPWSSKNTYNYMFLGKLKALSFFITIVLLGSCAAVPMWMSEISSILFFLIQLLPYFIMSLAVLIVLFKITTKRYRYLHGDLNIEWQQECEVFAKMYQVRELEIVDKGYSIFFRPNAARFRSTPK
ncbi:helix-turn-helix domain-containing protein [Zavarzinella formosa]|uniref:helix-turn-helix domain-containing protein n=1 Tax=Zavarzinella formosa TaxID=360055 RepID=UPI00036B62AD|nr:helix-turn-helix domain-containing protein [Zavarzinella formosa]